MRAPLRILEASAYKVLFPSTFDVLAGLHADKSRPGQELLVEITRDIEACLSRCPALNGRGVVGVHSGVPGGVPAERRRGAGRRSRAQGAGGAGAGGGGGGGGGVFAGEPTVGCQCRFIVNHRVKDLRSTINKVFRKGKDLSSVMDVLAIRVIIVPLERCYASSSFDEEDAYDGDDDDGGGGGAPTTLQSGQTPKP